ncbi:hypothetical protein [Parasitella parasitica]|uniref:Uncharacterized protein n=1 Tax=Parasitella parasitica TaxID=35722 RepID=A0A0B7MZK3_9FUNG|nr:hypothetical protein [Parasitella parasitica]
MNPNSVSRGPTPDADQVMEIDSNVISGLPAVPSFPAVSDISVVDAFKQLKGEISVLFVRIATVGSKPRSEIDPLVAFLNRKKADLESLEGVVGMLALGVARSEFSVTSILHHFAGVARNNVVPDGLPLFQWTGFVRDEKREVFLDVYDCLRRLRSSWVVMVHGCQLVSSLASLSQQ